MNTIVDSEVVDLLDALSSRDLADVGNNLADIADNADHEPTRLLLLHLVSLADALTGAR